MKQYVRYILVLLLICIVVSINAQTNISGVINNYAAVTAIGSQSVSVTSTSGFVVGDKVLLIQIKGASINQPNNPGYGSILAINDCGNYEMGIIASISSNTVTFSSPLLKTYSVAGLVQLVKVPVYNNATVTASLTCLPWNGTTGGILALECNGTLNLLANINASGKGFRGGALSPGTVTGCAGDTSNYMEPNTYTGSGVKGEGIFISSSLNQKGRGSNGNGGGAGTNINGGGAGGANFSDGGYGGNITSSASCPSAIPLNCGGIYGRALPYSNTLNKIFLGGGAGSGHMNDNVGTAGTNGGGIILIRATAITVNNNWIISDGVNNNIVAGIDGQGGGGAGGTVLIDACSSSSLNISVTGGNGGTDNYNGPDCHGKGGGGSGGVVWSSGSLAGSVVNKNGGQPGIFTISNSWCFNTSGGATAGQGGGALTGLSIPGAMPLIISLTVTTSNATICAGSSATLTASGANNYSWNNASTLSSSTGSAVVASPNTTTTYTVTGTTASCSNTVAVTVSVNPSPIITTASFTNTSCGLNNGSITVTSSPISNTYTWNPNVSSTNNATGLAVGNYSLTVSNGACHTSTVFSIASTGSTVALNVETNAPKCFENDGSFVISNITGGVAPYLISFNQTAYTSDTVFAQLSTGNYTLSIMDSNNCTTDSVLVMPENNGDYTLYIPNTFTPNNDKKNDIWYIQGTCLGALRCYIYNRWGEKIKELNDIKEGWDGTYKGTSVPDGVYVYLIEVETQSGTINKAGHITVFR